MPIFEFNCDECKQRFDVLTRVGTEIQCPQCGSGQVRKLLSTFSAHSPSSTDSACRRAMESGACGGDSTAPT